MFKLILSLICLAALAHAQCPTGSTNIHGNQRTNYCYIYLGKTDLHAKAESKCAALNLKLVQPKTKEGLKDLYKLYKGYDICLTISSGSVPKLNIPAQKNSSFKTSKEHP